MTIRFLLLLLPLNIAISLSGCASTDDPSDDQLSTFQSTPEKPEDSHGWGANLQGMGGAQR
jgi:uncharacterized protein YceK